ncbi:unnamed protein product [Owenia fusiformis]|uniref:Uncharacterized protein n=1 Tax=Owenia fusiformis TaxID=6347 RepID=A0A8J1TLK9_OWEFU|nr:unnamed protein product [Owenia fusiformis]
MMNRVLILTVLVSVSTEAQRWERTKREQLWLKKLSNFSKEYEDAILLPECTNSMKPNCTVAASFWDKDAVIAVDGLNSGHGREGVQKILEQNRGHGPDTYFSVHWYYCKGSRKGVALYGVGTVYSNDKREILEEWRVLTFFRSYNDGGWKIQYSFELKGGDPHAANM